MNMERRFADLKKKAANKLMKSGIKGLRPKDFRYISADPRLEDIIDSCDNTTSGSIMSQVLKHMASVYFAKYPFYYKVIPSSEADIAYLASHHNCSDEQMAEEIKKEEDSLPKGPQYDLSNYLNIYTKLCRWEYKLSN